MEETNSGRILFYDSEGQLEWEFVNVSGMEKHIQLLGQD